MERKDKIDTFGAVSLIIFALFLAFNQVVIKITNEGFQPVFFAAVRSFGSALLVGGWIALRGGSVRLERRHIGPALGIGAVFAVEFLCLFAALDLTTVTRSSIIFYTMPVWLSLAAHFLLSGERITRARAIGLALAFCGMAWAMGARGSGGGAEGALLGDMLALGGAIGWAGIALIARGTALRELRPQVQLFYQLSVSAPILFVAAFAFGPFLREPEAIHVAGLAFQIVLVSGAAFLAWLWLLSIYPASGVASFSFLSPVFGIVLGHVILGESAGPALLGAGALVAAGLVLINRPARPPG